MRKLNEECGVLGFYDNDGYNVAHMLYTGMFARAEYGIAIYKIGEIQAVAAKGISGPLSPFTHVTIEITVV